MWPPISKNMTFVKAQSVNDFAVESITEFDDTFSWWQLQSISEIKAAEGWFWFLNATAFTPPTCPSLSLWSMPFYDLELL